jgi:thienamycin biosynthesis protein ThnN
MKGETCERWLESVLRVHFDPEGGAPYWLEKARERGISPHNEIRSLKDLALFGPMDEEALKDRPIEDFVPRCYWPRKSEWVIGETGGTTGRPITTVYLDEEFHQAFVYPFEVVARCRNFPRGQNWLWIGPSGPHIIGTAAIACARALGSPHPFAVDFDPRWAKKLSPRSVGFKRYFDHVLEQSLRIVETQAVRVIFSTPKVLDELKNLMPRRLREAILGIHFGGMELDRDRFQTIAESFPNAVFISGYGNTLFGMCPEFRGDPRVPLDYYPLGPRLIFQTVPLDPEMTAEKKLKNPCAVGECGQIVFSRLDRSYLILNHFERDQGELISPSGCLEEFGLGIRNPHALKTKESEAYVAAGLY